MKINTTPLWQEQSPVPQHLAKKDRFWPRASIIYGTEKKYAHCVKYDRDANQCRKPNRLFGC